MFFIEHQIIIFVTKRIRLNFLLRPSDLKSDFTLTLGYLNLALNNPAQLSVDLLAQLVDHSTGIAEVRVQILHRPESLLLKLRVHYCKDSFHIYFQYVFANTYPLDHDLSIG